MLNSLWRKIDGSVPFMQMCANVQPIYFFCSLRKCGKEALVRHEQTHITKFRQDTDNVLHSTGGMCLLLPTNHLKPNGMPFPMRSPICSPPVHIWIKYIDDLFRLLFSLQLHRQYSHLSQFGAAKNGIPSAAHFCCFFCFASTFVIGRPLASTKSAQLCYGLRIYRTFNAASGCYSDDLAVRTFRAIKRKSCRDMRH